MTAEELARIEALCFPDANTTWSADEFARHMGATGQITHATPEGFIVGRATADQAEIYTICVLPDHRRRGIGRQLLRDFCTRARGMGVSSVFLEVSAVNEAARDLYQGEGFDQVGKRLGYYQTPEGEAIDALILQKAL